MMFVALSVSFPKRKTGSTNHGIVERENGCLWKE